MSAQKSAGALRPGGTSPAMRPNWAAWCVNQLSGPSPKSAHATAAPMPSTARPTDGPLSIHHQETGTRNPISVLPSRAQSSQGSGQTTTIESAMSWKFHNPPKRIDACTPKTAATMRSGDAKRRKMGRNT